MINPKLNSSNLFQYNVHAYHLNIFFVFILVVLCFSHIFFARGLDEDGSFRLAEMLLFDKFPYTEISRSFFHKMYQFPLYIFIKYFDVESLPFLIGIYVFGLISVHIFSIIFCYLMLPKNKKNYMFFPLFAFLIGPATSLGISISVGLSVASYIWFVTFLIYYSNLKSFFKKIILLLSCFPLILSHEMMIYISLFLIAICYFKNQSASKSLSNKIFTNIQLSFFIIIFLFQSILFFVKLNSNQNFYFFQDSLFSLKFIFNDNHLNLPIFLSLFLIFSLLSCLLKSSLREKISISLFFFLLVFMFIFSLSFLYNFQNYFIPVSDYHGRVWSITFPLLITLLLWFVFENKNITFQMSKYFILSCVVYCLILICSRVYSDLKFYHHQKYFSKHIQRCEGLVEWSEFKKLLLAQGNKEELKRIKYQLWKVVSSSLIYPRSNEIKSIILPRKNKLMEDCLKNNNSYKWCLSYLDFHRDSFIKNIKDQNFLNNPYFNFNPLFKNILQGKSYCI